jgi:DNA-binding NtrC family response regulator
VAAPVNPSDRPRILCVDDDSSILAALNRQLRRRYDLVLADGAAAGLARLRDAGPFAVLLTDLHMPGMDGQALIAEARAIAPRTVAVLFTGSTESDDAGPTDVVGPVFCLLPKPCLPDTLWATLDAAVAHHARHAACRGSDAEPAAERVETPP